MKFSVFVQAVGKEKVGVWLEETGMEADVGAVVLKPAEGGSSINVRFAFGIQDALEHARDLLANEDARLVRFYTFSYAERSKHVCLLRWSAGGRLQCTCGRLHALPAAWHEPVGRALPALHKDSGVESVSSPRSKA